MRFFGLGFSRESSHYWAHILTLTQFPFFPTIPRDSTKFVWFPAGVPSGEVIFPQGFPLRENNSCAASPCTKLSCKNIKNFYPGNPWRENNFPTTAILCAEHSFPWAGTGNFLFKKNIFVHSARKCENQKKIVSF